MILGKVIMNPPNTQFRFWLSSKDSIHSFSRGVVIFLCFSFLLFSCLFGALTFVAKWERGGELANIFCFILDENGVIISPRPHWFLNITLHFLSDLSFEMWGFEEGSNQSMDSPLQASIDEQNGGLPHQLSQRFRVRWHKGLWITLQHKSTHFCINGNYSWAPKYVRLEHLSIPAKPHKKMMKYSLA